MRVGAFEVDDSVRGLRNPQVISTLRPWVDAGNAPTLVHVALRDRLGARAVAELARPGEFFDFTRYRPMVSYNGDDRVLSVPNTRLTYARRGVEPDLLLLDMLEPQMRAEDYIESLTELLAYLGVKTFCRIGASYGGAPHTRPFRVSHSVGGNRVDLKTGRRLPQNRRYEGPTSVMNMLTDALEERGIETRALMMQLPHYARMEEDYSGAATLLEAVGEVYGLSAELLDWTSGYKRQGQEQRDELDQLVARDPALRIALAQMEAAYDAEHATDKSDTAPLSPEIEQFLNEITGTMDSGNDRV